MASSNGSSSLSIWLFIFLFVPFCTAQAPPRFRCSVRDKCQAMAGFVPRTETTYEAITELFQLGSIYDFFGANGLNETTPTSTKVSVNAIVKIPFPCACANGTGVSERKPVYTASAGDSLGKIAGQTFGGLVTDLQIAAANGIVNASSPFNAETRLLIPLPCSCDPFNFSSVVHLAYVVRKETSLAEISRNFSVSVDALRSLNDVPVSKSLIAGQVLDVPLRACNSSYIRATSPDVDLSVPRGSYALTANNCVKCSCNERYDPELECQFTSDLVKNKSSGCAWESCPAEFPYNYSKTFGTFPHPYCFWGYRRCLYAGYDDRMIWTLNYSTLGACDRQALTPPPPPPSNEATTERSLPLSWGLLLSLLFLAQKGLH